MQNMKEKQKLDRRNTYTPADAPQVRSNCDRALNSPEMDSVHGLKTPSNDPDVDIPGMRGRDPRVPVINMRNQPLMPTTPRNAGKLIIKKEGKKMDVSVKKVKLRRYGKGLKFNIQFLPPLKRWVSLEIGE